MQHYPPRTTPTTGTHTGWSQGRNRAAQAKFRRAVLKRDRHTCRRCDHHDPTGRSLQAHHVSAGYTVECGITVCRPCHREVDDHAR